MPAAAMKKARRVERPSLRLGARGSGIGVAGDIETGEEEAVIEEAMTGDLGVTGDDGIKVGVAGTPAIAGAGATGGSGAIMPVGGAGGTGEYTPDGTGCTERGEAGDAV